MQKLARLVLEWAACDEAVARRGWEPENEVAWEESKKRMVEEADKIVKEGSDA